MLNVQFKKIKGFSFSSHIDITKRAFLEGFFSRNDDFSLCGNNLATTCKNILLFYFSWSTVCMHEYLFKSPSFLQQQKKKLHTKRFFFLQLLSKKIEECFISQFTPIFWSTVLLDLLMNNMSRDNQILPECISLSMVLKPKKSAQYLQKNTARNALSQRILSTPQMTTTVTKYY